MRVAYQNAGACICYTKFTQPTGSLDKKNSEIVMNILHELSEQGKTVIVVTHSEEIVAQEKHVLYL